MVAPRFSPDRWPTQMAQNPLVAAGVAPQMQLMQVNCPPGSAPGSMVSITTPSGQQMQVQIPQGVGPGMPFQVQVPAAAPVVVAQPMAVAQQPQMMMQQPQVMQQPQMMMQPQMMQGNSYQMLAGFGDLFIRQQVEMVEAFTGFETENKYDIFAMGGTQHLFHAMEQSDCCTRQCCGPSREFKMTVCGMQGLSNPIITIMRPFRCRSPCCCNLQEVSVYAGTEAGQLLGVIREQWSCGDAQLNLEVNGRVEFKIQGPLCVCDGPCCGDQVFQINDPADQPIQTPTGAAEIRKMGAQDFGSAVQQQFTKADNFGATFPMSASPEAKALILASVFLIDFMFFENAQNNNGGHHHDYD